MLNKLVSGIAKVFGTKSDRDIKGLRPYVEAVNGAYAKLSSLSNDELRDMKVQIEHKIDARLADIDSEIGELHQTVKDNPDLGIEEKEEVFQKIDAFEKQRNEELGKVLDEVLPQTFALVKETARRFKENDVVTVTANDSDREVAVEKNHVTVSDDGKAHYSTSWTAGGNDIKWDMVHYDVQIIGGVVLHQGKIAEMATGEGKTLVSTLPAFLNALAKRGVHIVTVNDYLAKRDAEWMAPLFEFHGMRVDCIDKYSPHTEGRRKAYAADVTYGTNSEFGFDYLRDNMAHDPEELVQPKHHFAMVDEVDSVLVDEARTPLIISGPVQGGDNKEYILFRDRIEKLYQKQRKLAQGFLQDAKKKIEEGDKAEGGLALFRAHRAHPKYKPLIKFLGVQGMRQILQKTENIYLADNSKRMPEADEPLFYNIEEKSNSVNLTDKGIDAITKAGEDEEFFVLNDIGIQISEIEGKFEHEREKVKQESGLNDEERQKKMMELSVAEQEQQDKIINEYTAKTQRIHTVNQLLKAYTLFEKDVDYVTMNDKVMIVDEKTGRIMDGRRYSDGLHQALEAKENVKVEDPTQTYATITLQNYFRLYHKLAGMTGTAETEAGEFWEIYKLDVVSIPTNKPIERADREDLVYKTIREKIRAVGDEINEMVKQGRPVLVGTTSVESSQVMSRMLQVRGIEHQVLNAKQHEREADIVRSAGEPGTVTIATNMAGRGTDIKLAPESKAAGGLAIIGTERHESRRIDRQLRGRSGRQGDPGSSQFFVSLDDDLMRMFRSDRIAKVMDRMGLEDGEVIQHSMITSAIERAQKKVEENNFATRKRLLEYDDVMGKQRNVIYKRRRHALHGERLTLDIMNMFYDASADLVQSGKMYSYSDFKLRVLNVFGLNTEIDESVFTENTAEELLPMLYKEAYDNYDNKKKTLAKLFGAMLTPVKNTPEEERAKMKGEGLIPYKDETNDITFAMILNMDKKQVMIPFSTGSMEFFVKADLYEVLESDGAALVQSMEQMVALAVIDDLWKDHLREMDDLRNQVHMASIEQKDPLVIYKEESFQIFKNFLNEVNQDTVSALTRSQVMRTEVEDPKDIKRPKERKGPKLQEHRSADGSQGDSSSNNNAAAEKEVEAVKPRSSERTYGRNDRVTVRYGDGKVLTNVKYKKVEQDINANKCVVV